MRTEAFTFGSDPEFMLLRGGRIRSAIGVLTGNKLNRQKLGEHEYFYDNVLAECAVKPAGSRQEAVDNMRDCLRRFTRLVHPHRLMCKAAHEYDWESLDSREAKEIGCDREYCAYQLKEVVPPEEEFVAGQLRTAGGHVHLGANVILEDDFGAIYATKMLDLFLGIPAVFLDGDATTRRRKQLYGQAGTFRDPEYGVEYRALGNFWLQSPKLLSLVYDLCAFTLNFLAARKHLDLWTIDLETLDSDDAWNDEDFDPANCHRCVGYDAESVKEAINTMSKSKAQKHLNFIAEHLPPQLHDRILSLSNQNWDLYREWKLK